MAVTDGISKRCSDFVDHPLPGLSSALLRSTEMPRGLQRSTAGPSLPQHRAAFFPACRGMAEKRSFALWPFSGGEVFTETLSTPNVPCCSSIRGLQTHVQTVCNYLPLRTLVCNVHLRVLCEWEHGCNKIKKKKISVILDHILSILHMFHSATVLKPS